MLFSGVFFKTDRQQNETEKLIKKKSLQKISFWFENKPKIKHVKGICD